MRIPPPEPFNSYERSRHVTMMALAVTKMVAGVILMFIACAIIYFTKQWSLLWWLGAGVWIVALGFWFWALYLWYQASKEGK